MAFSATEVIAIIVALGGFVAGVGAVIVNIIVATRTGNRIGELTGATNSIAQVTARSLVETTALQGAVKEVHVLTNQNLSDVRNELKQANTEIKALREHSNAEIKALQDVVADLKVERDKIATAVAFAASSGGGVGARRSTDPPMPVRISTEDGPVPVDVQDHGAPKLNPNPNLKPPTSKK